MIQIWDPNSRLFKRIVVVNQKSIRMLYNLRNSTTSACRELLHIWIDWHYQFRQNIQQIAVIHGTDFPRENWFFVSWRFWWSFVKWKKSSESIKKIGTVYSINLLEKPWCDTLGAFIPILSKCYYIEISGSIKLLTSSCHSEEPIVFLWHERIGHCRWEICLWCNEDYNVCIKFGTSSVN